MSHSQLQEPGARIAAVVLSFTAWCFSTLRYLISGVFQDRLALFEEPVVKSTECKDLGMAIMEHKALTLRDLGR